MQTSIFHVCLCIIVIIVPVYPCPTQCHCEKNTLVCDKVKLEDLRTFKLPAVITEAHLIDNNIGEISSDILQQFEGLTALHITFNKLKIIPADTFKNFRKLETLVLNDNELNYLDRSCFRGLKNLLHLEIQRNKLLRLPVGVFNELRSIQSIRLQSNELQVIPNNVFTPLKSLQDLFVTTNKLSEIGDKAFQHLTMSRLGLSYNRLKRLPTTAFSGFRISGKILILFNPLECHCAEVMRYAVHLRQLVNKIWAYCESPDNVKNANLLKAHKNMPCSMCDLKPCKNNGECFGNKTDFTCKCTEQYKGKYCQKDICSHANQYAKKLPLSHSSKVIQGLKTTSPSFSRVVNGTKYVIVKKKVRDKDADNKLMMLYAICSLEFLIIVGFVAYFIIKWCNKWKKQSCDRQNINRQDINKKEILRQDQEQYPFDQGSFDIKEIMFKGAVPVWYLMLPVRDI